VAGKPEAPAIDETERRAERAHRPRHHWSTQAKGSNQERLLKKRRMRKHNVNQHQKKNAPRGIDERTTDGGTMNIPSHPYWGFLEHI